MPMMQYLSMSNKPLLTAEWQAWVVVAVAVVGIIVVGIGLWKSRKF